MPIAMPKLEGLCSQREARWFYAWYASVYEQLQPFFTSKYYYMFVSVVPRVLCVVVLRPRTACRPLVAVRYLGSDDAGRRQDYFNYSVRVGSKNLRGVAAYRAQMLDSAIPAGLCHTIGDVELHLGAA